MPPDRGRQRSKGKRAAIRAAAYRCIRDHGYHETSVDMICREAGISKGSLYWHYDSKQDIFVDLLETWANQVMEELYAQFEAALSGPDYIEAITEALQREIHRGRAVVPLWLEYAELARREPAIQQALAKFFRRARAAVADILRPVLSDRMDEAELRAAAAATFGAYVGLMVQDITDPDQADARRAVEHFMAWFRRWLQSQQADSTDQSSPARAEPAALESLLTSHDAATAAAARAVRDAILAGAPGAAERVVPAWRALVYEGAGHRVIVRPGRGTVRVSVPALPGLPDPPEGRLPAAQGRTHHVDLAVDVPVPAGWLAELARVVLAS